MTMQALPDLGEEHETFNSDGYRAKESAVVRRPTYIPIILTILISAIISALLSISTTLYGKERIAALFGLKVVTQTEQNTTDIKELRKLLALTAADSARMTPLIDELKTNLREVKASVAINESRFVETEKKLTELVAKVADQQRAVKLAESKIAAPKSVPTAAKARPVAQKVIPVVLVSVRSQGGILAASIREGTDTSDLLFPGDSWRGWQLIEGSPSTRSATFKYSGKSVELFL